MQRLGVPGVVTEPPYRAADGLRVLAFCDYFDPLIGGGAERVAAEVYRRLVDWGARVTVVTTAGDGGSWTHLGVHVVRVSTLNLSRGLGLQVSVSRGAARTASDLIRELRPHVLHANSLQFQTSVAAGRAARRSRVPLVLTAHVAGFESLAQPWRTIAGVHERTVGRFLSRRSARVIAVSDAVAAHVAARLGPDAPVRVVPNGVDHTVFHPPADAPARSHVQLVFVGRLVINKGPDTLIDAFAALRRRRSDVRLAVVGDGPLRDMLQHRARNLGVADALTFHGSSDDVAGHLRAADVVVRPSLTEGMPLAVLEAMASRLCVVASDVPGNASLIRDNDNGLLVPPNNPPALTAALERVVSDRSLRLRLAAVAHQDSGDYSWDRCARQTLDVLLDVA